MLHELRIYETMPGKLPVLNARFADHTTGFFNDHGIGMMGFWTDEIGESNKLTYILHFDGLGDREEKFASFQANPAWQAVRAETEVDGPLTARVRNTFMRVTPYSPEPKFSTNVQELRVYEGRARQAARPAQPFRQPHHRPVPQARHGSGGLLDPGSGHQQRVSLHAGLRQPGRPGEELEFLPERPGLAEGAGVVGGGRPSGTQEP